MIFAVTHQEGLIRRSRVFDAGDDEVLDVTPVQWTPGYAAFARLSTSDSSWIGLWELSAVCCRSRLYRTSM